MRTDFYERKEARIDRYNEYARRAEKESADRHAAADKISSFIPMCQPILVGHHSEARARRDQEKIFNNIGKAIEASEKAKYYEDRAESAANNNAIFSDDPEALRKLKNKLKSREESHELMKKINALYRKHDKDFGQYGLDEKETTIAKKAVASMQSYDNQPFASWALSNNNAEIRRIKDRIERQAKLESRETKETEFKGIKIIENAEANRLQIVFDSIPDLEIRQALKSHGFRWSPSQGAWQRQLTNSAIYAARSVLKNI